MFSRNLANKGLNHTPINLQLLALDTKDFIELECLGEGGGGLLLNGDLLGVGCVNHTVRTLSLLAVIKRPTPGMSSIKQAQK